MTVRTRTLLINDDQHDLELSEADETVTAPCALAQKLSQATNMEDVIKIQTEFVKKQTELFNERAQELRELCTKLSTAAGSFRANRH